MAFSWALMLLNFIFWLCVRRSTKYSTRSARGEAAVKQWRQRLRCWVCCCIKSRDRDAGVKDSSSADSARTPEDVLSAMARVFHSIFEDEGVDMVASDIAVGLILVQGAQEMQSRRGKKFRHDANATRWEPTPYRESTPGAPVLPSPAQPTRMAGKGGVMC